MEQISVNDEQDAIHRIPEQHRTTHYTGNHSRLFARWNIYILSYAWSGSSGSGVFSATGDYIGYVIAIDIGSSIVNGYQVLENVVLVVPAYKIDWSTIMEYDDLVPQEEKETN